MKKKHGTDDTGAKEGAGRIDWDRVRATTKEEIEAQAREDGDPEWTPEMLARAERLGARKQVISIRLDADVIEGLKAEGPGYQSRINAILRAYVEAHKKSA